MTNYYIIYNYIEYKQSQLHYFSAVRKQLCFDWIWKQKPTVFDLLQSGIKYNASITNLSL